MGKALIIKGADFSAHAVDSIFETMEFEQRWISNAASTNWGAYQSTDTNKDIRCRTKNGKLIAVAAGETITIKGLTNLAYMLFEYGVYVDHYGESKPGWAWTGATVANIPDTSNCITPYQSSYPPQNNGSTSVDEIQYTNENETTVYIALSVKWNTVSQKVDDPISPENINIIIERS